jgi:hypothetical protein
MEEHELLLTIYVSPLTIEKEIVTPRVFSAVTVK